MNTTVEINSELEYDMQNQKKKTQLINPLPS